MKANRGSDRRWAPSSVVAVALLAALAASCSERRVIPPPAPTPTPRPIPRPLPPPPQTRLDWRDAPLTPGDWAWSSEAGQSTARFAGGLLVLRCDRGAGTITLSRSIAAARPEPMTVTATAGMRTLTAVPQGGALTVTLPARDPVWDAMAFSRGRFALETAGAAPLIVPSWPEVGRVAQDCR